MVNLSSERHSTTQSTASSVQTNSAVFTYVHLIAPPFSSEAHLVMPHVHPEECIPRSVVGAWLLQLSSEVSQSMENLQGQKPNIVTQPLKRMQYIGEVALLAGKRIVLNQLARRLEDK